MGHPSVQKATRKCTRDDYLTWPEHERWEIIDGVAYNMTPAPSVKHQIVAGNFFSQLTQKLANTTCKPFIAPVDVILTEYDIVQPDIFVVCDKNKMSDANIRGAPDLVIEVLSPATALKDLREKKHLYEKFGIKEYIIIDPIEEYAEKFLLDVDGAYGKGEIFGPLEVLPFKVLEGIEINLWEIFEVKKG